MKQIANDKRYEQNPYTENMLIQTKRQMVHLGKNSDVLINQTTGEFQGTHITTYRQVDTEQFVKLFTQNITLTFDLTASGLKALNIIIWIIQRDALNRDIINVTPYDVEDFNRTFIKTTSIKTFYRGIKELIKAQILARHKSNATYFINPNFIFNGNRIAFTNVIERKMPISDEHIIQSALPLT